MTKQDVGHINLAQGIDRNYAEETLDATVSLITVDNFFMDGLGRLNKRVGYESWGKTNDYGYTTTRKNIHRIIYLGSQILMASPDSLDIWYADEKKSGTASYVVTPSTSINQDHGKLSGFTSRLKDSFASGDYQWDEWRTLRVAGGTESLNVGGAIVVASCEWVEETDVAGQDSGQLRVSIFDEKTGERLREEQTIGVVMSFKLLNIGNTAFIVACIAGIAEVKIYSTGDLTSKANMQTGFGLVRTFTDCAVSTYCLGVAYSTTSSNWFIAYSSSTGWGNYRLRKIDSSGASVATAVVATGSGQDGIIALGMDTAHDCLVLGYYYDTNTIKVESRYMSNIGLPRTAAAAALTGLGTSMVPGDYPCPRIMLNCWEGVAGVSFHLGVRYHKDEDSVGMSFIVMSETVGAFTNTYPQQSVQHFTPFSEFFKDPVTDRICIIGMSGMLNTLANTITTDSHFKHSNGTVVAVNVTKPKDTALHMGWPLEAVITAGKADLNGAGVANGCNVRAYGTSKKLYSNTFRKAPLFGLTTTVGVWELDYSNQTSYTPAHVGESVYISGGALKHWDGTQLQEAGWINPPSIVAIQGNAAGAMNGTFSYVALYETVDGNGNVEWSDVSDPVTYVATNLNNIQVSVSMPGITSHTNKNRRSSVTLFRTEDGGQVYYRVEAIPISSFVNCRATFTDAGLSTHYSGNARCYKQPGALGTALGRQVVGGARFICSHNDRLFIVADDDETVYYSGVRIQGEAPWFSQAQQFPVQGAGMVTGLASQDGRLVIFKESGIFIVDGDGPPDNGGNGTEFSPPKRLSAAVGCKDARSILTTDVGTFFRSRRGIELLDRSFQVQFIGSKVQYYTDIYPDVVGVGFDQTRGVVKIALSRGTWSSTGYDPANDSGITLLYNTHEQWWMTHTIKDSAHYPYPTAMSCMTVVPTSAFGPVTYYGAPGGYLLEEKVDGTFYNTNQYLDPNNSWIVSTVETGWIKLQNAPNTYSAFYDVAVMGRAKTNSRVVLSLAYNYNSFYSQNATFEPDVTNLVPSNMAIQPAKIQQKALRLKITDYSATDTVTYPIGSGKGMEWFGISFEFEPKPGIPKLPAAAKG